MVRMFQFVREETDRCSPGRVEWGVAVFSLSGFVVEFQFMYMKGSSLRAATNGAAQLCLLITANTFAISVASWRWYEFRALS